MISVEDWAEIRRLHRAEGMSIKAIARRLGVARNTVRDALRSDEPPRYERAGSGVGRSMRSSREIRELLGEFPEMPATVIAERIGWERGITVLRDRVAELRPLFRAAGSVPADELSAGRAGPVRSVAARRRRSRSVMARPTSCGCVVGVLRVLPVPRRAG